MEKGKLVLVATPIGNLADMSQRAIDSLKEADIILCEDTRHSKRLLDYYQIKKRTLSYHDHNEAERSEEVIKFLQEGMNIALITDAGMPCVSDPGYIIVDKVHKEGLLVTAIPGANAFLTAIALSGFDSSRFEFLGFLPRTNKKLDIIRSTINYPGLSVIYESPKRLMTTLQVISQLCPGRRVCIGRELTKIYEEIYRGPVEQVQEYFSQGVKGEIVIVLDRYMVEESINIEEKLRSLMDQGLSPSKAVKVLAKEYDLNKNEVYQISLAMKENQ